MYDLALFKAYNSKEIEDTALKVIRSGSIASGEYVGKFEEGFSNLIGQQNLINTIDMTSAIYLALTLSGVGAGDEVLTSTFACMATNSSIANIGAKAVWLDVERNSVSVDLAKFESAITPKTKAALIYHVAGYPSPIIEIAKICQKHNIMLIEDCNNALLSTINRKMVGSFGDFAVYSFYPNRQINCFEGGSLVCKSSKHFERAKKLRRFGIDFNTFRTKSGEINPDSDITESGWSITLNNLCSAVGYLQLSTVQERIDKARENALSITAALEEFDNVNIIKPLEGSNPSYWVYLIAVENRDEVLAELKMARVHASSLHHRNDEYSCFNTVGLGEHSNVSELQKRIIALPCGWWLSSEDIGGLIDKLKIILSVKRNNIALSDL